MKPAPPLYFDGKPFPADQIHHNRPSSALCISSNHHGVGALGVDRRISKVLQTVPNF